MQICISPSRSALCLKCSSRSTLPCPRLTFGVTSTGRDVRRFMGLPEQPEMRVGMLENVYGNALSGWVPDTICILHDGSYKHYFKTCSLLKITVFREVPLFSLASKNPTFQWKNENRGSWCLRNVCTYILGYMALHPTRKHYITPQLLYCR